MKTSKKYFTTDRSVVAEMKQKSRSLCLVTILGDRETTESDMRCIRSRCACDKPN